MPNRRANVCLLIALLFAGASSMRSQGKTQTIVFSVTDKKSQPVTELKTADVKVREDGKEQAVTSVRNVIESPLSVAFLVDTGASRTSVPDYWQGEAGSFFTNTLRQGTDKGAIFHFRNTLTTTQALTNEPAALATALKQSGASGASALYNALVMTAASLEKAPGRRAIVLLSDGDDNASRTTPEEAIAAIRDTNIVVFPIIVKSDRVQPPESAGNFIKDLADRTGGSVFTVTSVKEVKEVFKTIQGILVSQYELQYPMAAADGKFHKVRIELADKTLKVKQPTGYYARPLSTSASSKLGAPCSGRVNKEYVFTLPRAAVTESGIPGCRSFIESMNARISFRTLSFSPQTHEMGRKP
jgi:Ca-activated chloride channel family protein